jgi:hypothetical protein
MRRAGTGLPGDRPPGPEKDPEPDEFDASPAYTVVDPRPFEDLAASAAPTRESRNVVAVLAAYEAALDRERRKEPTGATMRTAGAGRIERIDELGAAGPLAARDVRGTADELAGAPPTRTGVVLSQLSPPRPGLRLFLLLLGLGLALAAAAAVYLRRW